MFETFLETLTPYNLMVAKNCLQNLKKEVEQEYILSLSTQERTSLQIIQDYLEDTLQYAFPNILKEHPQDKLIEANNDINYKLFLKEIEKGAISYDKY